MKDLKKIGGGIFMVDKIDGDILLGKRSKDYENGVVWCIFGGTFEPKDGYVKNTAKREFKEESGYEGDYFISKKPFFIHTDPTLDYYTYLGIIDKKFIPTIDDEHIAWGWFSVECLDELNLHLGFKQFVDMKREEIDDFVRKVKSGEINP
jgi:ADP-ribose pyrophosphatase YjhB (NUDIX family)